MTINTQSRRVLALTAQQGLLRASHLQECWHCAGGAHAANRERSVGACGRGVYRLGESAHADHFVLKGAMLFNLCIEPRAPAIG